MPTVLITGANRGIGLEFARQYAGAGWSIIATVRQPSAELDRLGARVETVDMQDLAAVEALGRRIAELDLLIANAATRFPTAVTGVEQAIEWSNTLTVNAIAPYLLAQSVLPQVRSSGGKLIAISSVRGCISDSSPGGSVAYRSSKTALNSAWRRLAIENGGIICVAFHPGWVRTREDSPAPMTAETSVRHLRRMIASLKPEHSGHLFDHLGKQMPW